MVLLDKGYQPKCFPQPKILTNFLSSYNQAPVAGLAIYLHHYKPNIHLTQKKTVNIILMKLIVHSSITACFYFFCDFLWT